MNQKVKNSPIEAGPLRDSVFSQIDPTYFLTKFRGAQRMKFPFTCILSKDVMRTPIINRACEDVCYFSGAELIRKLKNQLVAYKCDKCGRQVHSKDLLFDPGFDHHITCFDNNRNKNVLNDSFVINSNGMQSVHQQTQTIDIIDKRFEKMRLELVLSLFNSEANMNAGICIDRDAIDKGFRQILQQYNIKGFKGNISVTRGRKNHSDTVFTTMAILHNDEFFQMNMAVNGETYFMTKESEIFINQTLGAFFIVAAHKSKLFVLRAYLSDIEGDIINFKEIASFEKRQFFGVSRDDTNIYVFGGINLDKMMLYKQAYRVDCKTGTVNRLPDMSLERCGFKALLVNNRIYIIGGGNRNTGPWMLNDFNQYYDLASNKWVKFAAGALKGYNFALIPSTKPNRVIVYGGSDDPAYDNQLRKYYDFDCTNFQEKLIGEVKDNIKFDFDFDNTATVNQTLIRALKGNRQELAVLRFLDNGSYELKRKDVV